MIQSTENVKWGAERCAWQIRWAIYPDGRRLQQLWEVCDEHQIGEPLIFNRTEWRDVPEVTQ
jgi:hypothetical protein